MFVFFFFFLFQPDFCEVSESATFMTTVSSNGLNLKKSIFVSHVRLFENILFTLWDPKKIVFCKYLVYSTRYEKCSSSNNHKFLYNFCVKHFHLPQIFFTKPVKKLFSKRFLANILFTVRGMKKVFINKNVEREIVYNSCIKHFRVPQIFFKKTVKNVFGKYLAYCT